MNFLKHPAKGYGKFPIIVGGFFEKVQWNTPTKRWKLSNISRGYFQELTKNTPTNRQANVHIKWTEKEITDYELQTSVPALTGRKTKRKQKK